MRPLWLMLGVALIAALFSLSCSSGDATSQVPKDMVAKVRAVQQAGIDLSGPAFLFFYADG